jgi:RNA polymerase sigma-70 factor (ECF subfamily)
MNNEEQQIINQLYKGDEAAYKYLYAHHYVVLCQAAYAFLSDRFAAQTLVDELFVHLYEIRHTLHITISLRAYLMRAVRNRCLNRLAQEYERREVCLSALAEEEDRFLHSIANPDTPPLGILLEKELEEEIRKAVDQLPAETRTVFKKSRYEEKTYQEIAAELQISVNTVKYHIKQALTQLYKALHSYL